jgi:hypothetical protein
VVVTGHEGCGGLRLDSPADKPHEVGRGNDLRMSSAVGRAASVLGLEGRCGSEDGISDFWRFGAGSSVRWPSSNDGDEGDDKEDDDEESDDEDSSLSLLEAESSPLATRWRLAGETAARRYAETYRDAMRSWCRRRSSSETWRS